MKRHVLVTDSESGIGSEVYKKAFLCGRLSEISLPTSASSPVSPSNQKFPSLVRSILSHKAELTTVLITRCHDCVR